MGLHNKKRKSITQTISNSKNMTVALSCIARSIVTITVGIVFTSLGLAGIQTRQYALLIDYENDTPVFNCSGFVLVYGINLILVGVGVLLTKKLRKSDYLLMILTLLCSHAMLTTMVFFCTYNWIVRYGHVPILDVEVRSYDKDSKCWNGIERLDYNTIYGKNCFTVDKYIYCASCRIEYYYDELTFIKEYRFRLQFMILLLMVLNCYNLWKLHNVYYNAKSKSVATSVSKLSYDLEDKKELYYDTPKNNQPIVTSTAIPTTSATVNFCLDHQSLLLPSPPKSWIFNHDDDNTSNKADVL
uniref:Arif-1 n=1 Tax=Spodoptera frugiperda nuclear polyhedrosis virus TaxID=10455 RepID=E9L625_NPVSF|nr:arif-1 [Spodoptera frugiperda multiple nucleopolyhedrovirus]AFH58970.1 arif-1 [Spodoptera frugiperda multiple nucleopolyhedrovirus]QED40233.1 ARIF-1 [Spodoptera frugiperda multiple nucleopolyhedrovirus]